MGLFQAFNISASGMTAERFRTDIIAQNIANVNTTSTKEGTPYRRKIVTFSEKNVTPFSQIYSSSKKAAVGNGVKVSSVTSDYSTDFIKEYDPSNPDADADGYVSYPNVNTVTEMTNLIDATRAYEANATAFEASKSMAQNGFICTCGIYQIGHLCDCIDIWIRNINGISTGDIKSFFNNTSLTKTDKTDSFSDVLSAAMGSIGETNDLQNAAEQEEVRFALGESDNTHDLLVAETKAAVALQYTVAVRDKIIDAYKELMQMSI